MLQGWIQQRVQEAMTLGCSADTGCHHASGAAQGEPAHSVKSIGVTVDTGGSYCVKWSSENFCLVTSSYKNAHPYCACAFVRIRSPMYIHHLGSEVWLWRIERFAVKASVFQLHRLFLGLDSSFSQDSHSRQYIQYWLYSYFIYFHTVQRKWDPCFCHHYSPISWFRFPLNY